MLTLCANKLYTLVNTDSTDTTGVNTLLHTEYKVKIKERCPIFADCQKRRACFGVRSSALSPIATNTFDSG